MGNKKKRSMTFAGDKGKFLPGETPLADRRFERSFDYREYSFDD